MNLFNSIIVTYLIVIAVWALALFQPNTALAESVESSKVVKLRDDIKDKVQNVVKDKVDDVKNELVAIKAKVVEPKKPRVKADSTANSTIEISGISTQIQLADINTAWQTFHSTSALHSQLKRQPTKVYALYQNFFDNFRSANVTIGYNANSLNSKHQATSINRSNYAYILRKGAYTDSQLQQAWGKINYSQLNSVLEIHYLDQDSNVTSTELLVAYK